MKTLLLILFISLTAQAQNIDIADWSNIPMKQTIVTGKKGAAAKFKTNSSKTYKGYFSAAANSSGGNLTRRLWFSKSALGEPLKQMFRKDKNACDVSGVEIKLSWTQEDKPAYITTCKLERDTVYYLNHSQSGFGNGAGPTKTSALIRGSSTSGKN